MAIQFETRTFPFTGGIDTGKDPKLVQPPSLLGLVNGYWDKAGRIVKRNGYTAIGKNVSAQGYPSSAGKTINKGFWLAAIRKKLVMGGMASGTAGPYSLCASYDASSASDPWHEEVIAGRPVAITQLQTDTAAPNNRGADLALAGGILLCLHRRFLVPPDSFTSTWRHAAADSVTGEVFESVLDQRNFLMTTDGVVEHAVSMGAKALIVRGVSASVNLATSIFDSTAPRTGITDIGNIVTNASNPQIWDLERESDTRAVLVYKSSAGLTVAQINNAGTKAASQEFSLSDPPGANVAVGVVHTGGVTRYVIAWRGATTTTRLYFFVVNAADLTQFLAPVYASDVWSIGYASYGLAVHGLESDDGSGVSTEMLIAANGPPEETTSTHTTSIKIFRCSHVTGAIASPVQMFGVGLISRWFCPDSNATAGAASRICIAITHGESWQPMIGIVEAGYFANSPANYDTARIIASFNRGRGESYRYANELSHVVRLSADKFALHLFCADRLYDDSAIIFSPRIALLDFSGNSSAHVTVQDADLIAIPGTVMSVAQSVSDLRHSCAPRRIFGSTASTGGMMSNGTYAYYACATWKDASGRLYRSARSPILWMTLTGGTATQTVTIFIFPAWVSTFVSWAAAPDVIIGELEMYRTTNGGSTFYRVGTIQCASPDTQTFIDILPDVSLTGNSLADNEILYTTGGLTENTWWPNPAGMCPIDDRLAIASNDEGVIYISKSPQAKTGVRFSELHTMFTPANLVNIAHINSALIAFLDLSIHAFYGQWPNDLGVGNIQHQVISTALRCVSRPSVCEFPGGIFFKSQEGWMIVDAALQVQYAGDVVKAYDSLTVTNAVLFAEKHQVRITHSNGTVLIYDFRLGQWATWTAHPAVDATNWNGAYTWLKSDGTVLTQSSGFMDDTAAIQLKISTAWIALGNQGRQRVAWAQFLGEFRSAHRFNVDIFYDYVETVVEHYQFDLSTANDPYQCRVAPARQECQAIRFDFYDSNQSGTGESFAASGVALEIGAEGGLAKLPVAKSA